MENNINYLDPYNFYFELPLYVKINFEESEIERAIKLLSFKEKLSAYNPQINDNTTFDIAISRVMGGPLGVVSENSLSLISGVSLKGIATCRRSELKSEFYFKIDHDYDFGKAEELGIENIPRKWYIFKYGQNPSIADFHLSKVKNYKSVLRNEKMKEFTTAIGLAANGIGIGSFVYLRRIFEDLVEEAHQQGCVEEDWNEQAYNAASIDNKIKILKEYLPEFLVEHRGIYRILSRGVHELEEKECLQYFSPLKDGIELILDQKLEANRKKQKLDEASKHINAIERKLNSKK
jgi:hypothetical protein